MKKTDLIKSTSDTHLRIFKFKTYQYLYFYYEKSRIFEKSLIFVQHLQKNGCLIFVACTIKKLLDDLVIQTLSIPYKCFD